MIKLSTRKIGFAVAGALVVLFPAAPVFAQSVQSIQSINTRPMFMGRHSGTSSGVAALSQSTSENWSGYASTGANNSYTSVSSSWTQSALTCATSGITYSANWVGIDGYSDQSVEQIGTEANCVNGSPQYYVWYEMYPQNPSEVLTRLAVSPGNVVSASVNYTPPATNTNPYNRYHYYNPPSSGSFTLTLTDNTTGASYSTTQTANRTVNRSSAEVITEAPYSGGILPLANFGTINYDASKINALPLGSATGLQAITMDDPHGMVSTPSALDSTKQNFSVVWSDPGTV